MIGVVDYPLAEMTHSAYCAQCGVKRELTPNNRCAYCGSGSVSSRLNRDLGVLWVAEIRVVRSPDELLVWADDGGASES